MHGMTNAQLNAFLEQLARLVESKAATVEDAAKLLVECYDIDNEQALADAQRWVEKLAQCALVDMQVDSLFGMCNDCFGFP